MQKAWFRKTRKKCQRIAVDSLLVYFRVCVDFWEAKVSSLSVSLMLTLSFTGPVCLCRMTNYILRICYKYALS